MKNNNLEITAEIQLTQGDAPYDGFTFIGGFDLIVPLSEEDQKIKVKKLFENMYYIAQQQFGAEIELEGSAIRIIPDAGDSLTTIQELSIEIERIKSIVSEKLNELRINKCKLIIYGEIF